MVISRYYSIYPAFCKGKSVILINFSVFSAAWLVFSEILWEIQGFFWKGNKNLAFERRVVASQRARWRGNLPVVQSAKGERPRPLLLGEGAARRRRVWRGPGKILGSARMNGCPPPAGGGTIFPHSCGKIRVVEGSRWDNWTSAIDIAGPLHTRHGFAVPKESMYDCPPAIITILIPCGLHRPLQQERAFLCPGRLCVHPGGCHACVSAGSQRRSICYTAKFLFISPQSWVDILFSFC